MLLPVMLSLKDVHHHAQANDQVDQLVPIVIDVLPAHNTMAVKVYLSHLVEQVGRKKLYNIYFFFLNFSTSLLL